MFKERAHKFWIVADCLQLLVHAFLQLFALFKGRSGRARAFSMTPHQFVRVQIGGVAGKKMEREFSTRLRHIALDHPILMRGQAVNDQISNAYCQYGQQLQACNVPVFTHTVMSRDEAKIQIRYHFNWKQSWVMTTELNERNLP